MSLAVRARSGLKLPEAGVDAPLAMNAAAAELFPVVVDVTEAAANEPHPRGTPIELPSGLSLWDVFAALQDAAEEEGATPDEADRLAVAAYWELSRSLVSGRGIETSSA